jgi:hypothetical protein
MWIARGKFSVAVQQFDDFGAVPGTEFGAAAAAARAQIISVSQALTRYRKDGREFIRRPSVVNPQCFNPATER